MKVVIDSLFLIQKMSKTAIITAGGIGKRMGLKVPKQFMLLNGKPLLYWTIEKFYKFDSKMQILVSLPKEWIKFWEDSCEEYQIRIPHKLVEGGTERFHSIQNALQFATGDLIAIHDGVRPFVSVNLIQNGFETAKLKGSAVPVVELKESIRTVSENSSKAVERNNFRIVQTPQTFQKEIIEKAYQQDFNSSITDDACLVESIGYEIQLIPGEDQNIKITTPIDIKLAEILIK